MRLALLICLALTVPTWADLDSDVRSVLPKAHESYWSSIPWRVDLNQARRQAQQTGKPIFAWVMDGHVLAAT